MSLEEDVVIVGAGLAGCLLGVYLARRGHTVLLLEAKPDPRATPPSSTHRGARSINLALSTRGLTALGKVGLLEKVTDHAVPMYARCLHQKAPGDAPCVLQSYGQTGQRLLSVSRAELHSMLLNEVQACQGVQLFFETPVVSLDAAAKTVTLANGDVCRARELVVGADGTWSSIRAELLKQTKAVDFSQTFLSAGYKEIHFPPDSPGAAALRENKEALHIWPGRKGPNGSLMMLIALPNTDGSFTGTLFMDNQVFDEIGDDRAAIHAFFKEHFAEVLEMREHLIDEYLRNPAPPLVTIRCSRYSDGNVLILGDAAHAIVPFYGQGINAGFEDVRLFDDMLENANGNFRLAANHFSATRKRDVDAMADLAIANFEEMALKTSSRLFLAKRKFTLLVERLMPSANSLYSMISFSNVPYHTAVEISKNRRIPIPLVASAVALSASIGLATVLRSRR